MSTRAPDPLRADCASCRGLCCVVPAFAASADFALDKPAGQPCPHLGADHRCGVHGRLRELGFPGCTGYDCFGAGQRITAALPVPPDWLDDAATRARVTAVLAPARTLHEVRWLLDRALDALGEPGGGLGEEVARAAAATEALVARLLRPAPDAPAVTADGVGGHREAVNELLRRCSRELRSRDGRPGPQLRGADLVGADLRRRDLRRAELRGALLIGADLRGVDLTGADLTGADLRAADLRGADLGRVLFCSPPQLATARGDATTRLPAGTPPPAHWDVGAGTRRGR